LAVEALFSVFVFAIIAIESIGIDFEGDASSWTALRPGIVLSLM